MILVIRIVGNVKQNKKDLETLSRLRLNRKFSSILIDEKDSVRIGMVRSVKNLVAYGVVSEEFVKELKSKRGKRGGVYFLHPPIGGFKKSSKVAAPRGILGRHEDIVKLAGRML